MKKKKKGIWVKGTFRELIRSGLYHNLVYENRKDKSVTHEMIREYVLYLVP